MVFQPWKCPDILLCCLVKLHFWWHDFSPQQRFKIRVVDLLALSSYHHAVKVQALCDFFHPIVQSRNNGILSFKGWQEAFLKFEIELNKLHQSQIEILLCLRTFLQFVMCLIFVLIIKFEKEVCEQSDSFLKEGMVVNGKFTIDICGGLLHENLLLVCIVRL